MRSLLFAPGDDERKIAEGLACAADALIFDLADSVAPDRKTAAREVSRGAILTARKAGTSKRLILRVNALPTGLTDADLDAVMAARPDAVMLPECASGADVQQLAAKLAVAEARHGLTDGATGIIAAAAETAGSLFSLGGYRGASQRLMGLAWSAGALAASLGASASRESGGPLASPLRLARGLTLAGARHAGVAAIDTDFASDRAMESFETECRDAARDGFTAKLAMDPAQVEVINRVFERAR